MTLDEFNVCFDEVEKLLKLDIWSKETVEKIDTFLVNFTSADCFERGDSLVLKRVALRWGVDALLKGGHEALKQLLPKLEALLTPDKALYILYSLRLAVNALDYEAAGKRRDAALAREPKEVRHVVELLLSHYDAVKQGAANRTNTKGGK